MAEGSAAAGRRWDVQQIGYSMPVPTTGSCLDLLTEARARSKAWVRRVRPVAVRLEVTEVRDAAISARAAQHDMPHAPPRVHLGVQAAGSASASDVMTSASAADSAPPYPGLLAGASAPAALLHRCEQHPVKKRYFLVQLRLPAALDSTASGAGPQDGAGSSEVFHFAARNAEMAAEVVGGLTAARARDLEAKSEHDSLNSIADYLVGMAAEQAEALGQQWVASSSRQPSAPLYDDIMASAAASGTGGPASPLDSAAAAPDTSGGSDEPTPIPSAADPPRRGQQLQHIHELMSRHQEQLQEEEEDRAAEARGIPSRRGLPRREAVATAFGLAAIALTLLQYAVSSQTTARSPRELDSATNQTNATGTVADAAAGNEEPSCSAMTPMVVVAGVAELLSESFEPGSFVQDFWFLVVPCVLVMAVSALSALSRLPILKPVARLLFAHRLALGSTLCLPTGLALLAFGTSLSAAGHFVDGLASTYCALLGVFLALGPFLLKRIGGPPWSTEQGGQPSAPFVALLAMACCWSAAGIAACPSQSSGLLGVSSKNVQRGLYFLTVLIIGAVFEPYTRHVVKHLMESPLVNRKAVGTLLAIGSFLLAPEASRPWSIRMALHVLCVCAGTKLLVSRPGNLLQRIKTMLRGLDLKFPGREVLLALVVSAYATHGVLLESGLLSLGYYSAFHVGAHLLARSRSLSRNNTLGLSLDCAFGLACVLSAVLVAAGVPDAFAEHYRPGAYRIFLALARLFAGVRLLEVSLPLLGPRLDILRRAVAALSPVCDLVLHPPVTLQAGLLATLSMLYLYAARGVYIWAWTQPQGIAVASLIPIVGFCALSIWTMAWSALLLGQAMPSRRLQGAAEAVFRALHLAWTAVLKSMSAVRSLLRITGSLGLVYLFLGPVYRGEIESNVLLFLLAGWSAAIITLFMLAAALRPWPAAAAVASSVAARCYRNLDFGLLEALLFVCALMIPLVENLTRGIGHLLRNLGNVVGPLLGAVRAVVVHIWRNPLANGVGALLVLFLAFKYHNGDLAMPAVVWSLPGPLASLGTLLGGVASTFSTEISSWATILCDLDLPKAALFKSHSFALVFFLTNLVLGKLRVYEVVRMKTFVVPVAVMLATIYLSPHYLTFAFWATIPWMVLSFAVGERERRERLEARRGLSEMRESRARRRTTRRRSSRAGPAAHPTQPTRIFEGEACIICLCEWEGQEERFTAPCGHQFHPPCISEWLRRQHRCPVCREPCTLGSRVLSTVF